MFQTILTEQNKQTAQLLALLSDNFGGEQNSENAAIDVKIPIATSPDVPSSVQAAQTNETTKPIASPVVEEDVPVEGNSEMLDLMQSVVADKTGYPAEMLELSMDMEADLGIDSIKRVEIFGAITEQSDKLTDINPNDLAELRTLQEIVDYISTKSGISATTSSAVPSSIPVTQTVETTKPIATPVVETAVATEGNSEMLNLMLSVVADKTGYPAEMLELSMDMEADLGIDSIKRVEIFGAITEQSDKLTDINPNDLAELRTLQEIVDYISTKAGISATTSSAIPNNVPAAQTVANAEPIATSVVETAVATEGNSEMLDLMLSVVADKTGYPAEMLELSMDMEADLGIDSIKRVEIFGAITEQSDKLTDINPNDLAELRTLQEIVDYISTKAGISATTSSAIPNNVPAAQTVANAEPIATSVVETAVATEGNSEMLDLMLSVVADKTGYPAEMLELSMDMEADLGIDSIKRVEIFGAITEQSDKLTDINPNDLAELRTLQEIVDYISTKAGINATTNPDAPSVVPAVQTVVNTDPIATPVVETVVSTEGNSEMLDLMLSVVADKTGYPAEMLELSMDMEADLGIDSIKRVEIFGAITEQSDKLTDINPNDLAELRTLQEIVNYISTKAGDVIKKKSISLA
jgi:acyl carrier protein